MPSHGPVMSGKIPAANNQNEMDFNRSLYRSAPTSRGKTSYRVPITARPRNPPRVGMDVRFTETMPPAGHLPGVTKQPDGVDDPEEEDERREQIQTDRRIPRPLFGAFHHHRNEQGEQRECRQPEQRDPAIVHLQVVERSAVPESEKRCVECDERSPELSLRWE